MRRTLRALLGVLIGLLVGGGVGVLLGLAWITLGEVSAFEGMSGYVVGFIFLPLGALMGAIGGAVIAAGRA